MMDNPDQKINGTNHIPQLLDSMLHQASIPAPSPQSSLHGCGTWLANMLKKPS
jgi:hypothetical protein